MDKEFLLVVNPISGKSNSLKTLDKIRKYLSQNNIQYSFFISRKPRSIIDNIKNYDFSKISKIICIGGDGTYNEILSGLYEHKIDLNRITIVPTNNGSGNGLYSSISYLQYKEFDLLPRHNDNKLNLIDYKINNEEKISFLGISIGIISDVDLSTEWLRFIGDKRYDLGGIYFMLNTYSYRLKVEYTKLNNSKHMIEDDFIQVFLFNVSHCSTNLLVNPEQKLNSKTITLVLIPSSISKYELMNMFLNISSDYSPFLENDKITVINVVNFVITPLDSQSENSLTIDGEKVLFNYPLSGNVSDKIIKIK
jgi:sphingosine kinase